jgi:biotin carboxyl carrier protein
MADVQVRSDVAGVVTRIAVKRGDHVGEGDDLVILEAMKMELPVPAPAAGVITAVLVQEGDAVAEGQAVATLAR